MKKSLLKFGHIIIQKILTMNKGYNDFINENNDPNYIEDLYKMLVRYIVSELNKGTEFIGADPIKETDIQFDKDKTDIGEEWYYCTIQSIRLSSEPIDEPVDDHMYMLKSVLKGFAVLDKILEDIQKTHNIFIHSMISKGGSMHKAAIRFTIEKRKIEKNKKRLDNLLRSSKGIDRFSL